MSSPEGYPGLFSRDMHFIDPLKYSIKNNSDCDTTATTTTTETESQKASESDLEFYNKFLEELIKSNFPFSVEVGKIRFFRI